MTTTELVGLITGVLTILGVVVALTKYVTQLQFKMRQERLKAENELAEKRIGDLAARNKELLNEIVITKRVGTAALTRKMDIDDELLSIMKTMQAEAGSIFVPLPSRSSSGPFGLVFLSILPLGKQTAKLKKKIIPMRSSAGRCFTIAKPYVSPKAEAAPEHYSKADLVSGYRTEDMLNFPLRHRGETVGVLQLLNKEGSEYFTESDIQLAEPFTGPLATKVSNFISTPENFEILGITPEQDAEHATVMFCDLTRSSILFQEMNVSMAIQHINEYLERISDIGLSYGATVDKYTGDGVLFRLNVPRPVKDHPFKAVSAALEMRTAFEKLKSEWITMGRPLTSIYTRIGIAYGEVHQAVIGHPQYQYLTIFGTPVNVAVNLCEAAVRDRNVIIIDKGMYDELSGKVLVEQLPKERLGKAMSYVKSAYELQGLAS